MEWTPANFIGDFIEESYAADRQRWDIPENWLPMRYYEALSTLFRIENSIRLLVYCGLKKHMRDDWVNAPIPITESDAQPLRIIAKQRRIQEEKFEYLTEVCLCPLMYLTAGELSRIILSEKYWKYFRAYIGCPKNQIQAKLDEIACVRNALAHFRPISESHLEVVKRNGIDVLKKFNKLLSEAIKECCEVSSWRAKSKIKTLYIDVSFAKNPIELTYRSGQSTSGEWNYLIVNVESPYLSTKLVGQELHCKVALTTIDTILKSFPKLKSSCILGIPGSTGSQPTWDGDSELPKIIQSHFFVLPNNPKKTVNAPKSSGSQEHSEDEIRTKSNEKFVNYKSISVVWKEVSSGSRASHWKLNLPSRSRLYPNISENVENWGQLGNFWDDAVTEMPRYPWIKDIITTYYY